MKSVNAVELRQSMGKVVARLNRDGEPILLARGKKPVAALISLRDFNERFVTKAATEARKKIFAEMDALARPAADPTSTLEILRAARQGG